MRSSNHCLFTAALALTLASCGTSPPLRTLACNAAVSPPIETSSDGKSRTTTLKVLTYNIEGLGFPARKGRGPELRQIGSRLSATLAARTGPDIVLFQEMFSGAAKNAVGYRAAIQRLRRGRGGRRGRSNRRARSCRARPS